MNVQRRREQRHRLRRPRSMVRPRIQAENRSFRKESLLRAAIESVAEYDISGATVERICTRAGASRGLIAHYYASKEDLLVAALNSKFDDALRVKESIAKDLALTPVTKIELIAQSSFESPTFDWETVAAWQAFTNASRSIPVYDKPIRRLSQTFRKMVGPLFKAAANDRSMTIDSEAAAFGLLALIDGLWGSLATGKDGASPEEGPARCKAYIRGCLSNEGT